MALINEIKRDLADVLTTSRLILSPLLLLPLLILGKWEAAAIVAFLLILTDAYDGIFARKWSPKVRSYKMNPGQFDENADGALTNSLLIGVGVRMIVADIKSWPEASLSWYTIVVLGVIALVITGALIWLTGHTAMPWCKRFDILNGFYYGFLLAVAVWIILDQALSGIVAWVIIGVAVVGFVWIKRDRLFDRDESKYANNKPLRYKKAH